jgi:hypothetical protein
LQLGRDFSNNFCLGKSGPSAATNLRQVACSLASILSINHTINPQLIVLFGQKNLNLIIVFRPVFSYIFSVARGRQISSVARLIPRLKWTNKTVNR